MHANLSMSRRAFMRGTALAGAALAGAPLKLSAQSSSPFKIIGFSKPFQQLGFSETAETVAAIGWDGIECPVRPGGQIEPEQAPDRLPELVESLKNRGKAVAIMTTAIRSLSDPHAEQQLRTAAKLGINRYRLGSWRYDRNRPIPDQLREIQAALRDLAEANQELGLQAGFQNHSGSTYVGAPVWDIWMMVKDLPPQQMGLCFDIGHATLEGGYSWPTQARLVESHLTAVYVKDFLWKRTDRGWRAEWVMLGQGMVSKDFFAWLKTTNYTGPISQHQEYDHGKGQPMIEKMRQDLQVLRGWLS